MAQGDLVLFNELSGYLGTGEMDLDATDVVKVGLVTAVTTPTAATISPTWSDFSANEVSGTNYTPGGGIIPNPTFTQVSASTYAFDGDTVSWTQNAGGPTDITWGIIYNDSNATDMCIGYIDMTTSGGTPPISLAAGNIQINWNNSGIFQLA